MDCLCSLFILIPWNSLCFLHHWYISVNINFLLGILDVYLEFLKFIVGRTDSYTQALLDIGNSFSVTESVPKRPFPLISTSTLT